MGVDSSDRLVLRYPQADPGKELRVGHRITECDRGMNEDSLIVASNVVYERL